MENSELLADEIAQQIKKKIQTQVYVPDERLTVRKLCEEYGASETPVKQALNQLLSTGLVVSIPKCGMRVRKFNFQDMKDIWEARVMIEQYCCAGAIRKVRSDPAFVESFNEIIRITDALYDTCIHEFTKENFYAIPEYDHKLHTMLVDASDNPQIIRMYDGLNAHSGLFLGFNVHTPDTLVGVKRDHHAIVDAMLNCDSDEMKRAVEDHIRNTMRIYSTKETNRC